MKNLKLKTGLCGLALTSFLALNTHSIVHADTVQNGNANNNAITWNSDSDDSQVVKSEPQQDKVSPTVQKRVQSDVQASQAQLVQNKKVMVSNVSSAPSSQKRAETSIVRQLNVQTGTVNRANADNHAAKVANVNATDSIKITNPQNNQVVVHYVKTNGQSVQGVQDTVINTNVSGNGDYQVPKGYTLAKNGYTVQYTAPDPQSIYTWTWRNNDANPKDLIPVDGKPVNAVQSSGGLWSGQGVKTDSWTVSQSSIDFLNNFLKTKGTQVDPGDFMEVGGDYDADGALIVESVRYYKASGNDGWYNLSYRGHSNTPGYVFEFRDSAEFDADTEDNPDYDKKAPKFSDMPDNFKSLVRQHIKNYKVTEDQFYDRIMIGNPDKSSVFIDNSGQVKSAIGNHINLQLTQPVPVNDASQTRKTAERIISVNLPDDSAVRDRYKGILNDKNQIVQTITFTRTMVKDNLTGTTLTQTPWTGPSDFPAVTLPDIPGYTMTMN